MDEVKIDIDYDGCVQLVAEDPWLSADGEEWTASGYRLDVMGTAHPVDPNSEIAKHYLDDLIEEYKREKTRP